MSLRGTLLDRTVPAAEAVAKRSVVFVLFGLQCGRQGWSCLTRLPTRYCATQRFHPGLGTLEPSRDRADPVAVLKDHPRCGQAMTWGSNRTVSVVLDGCPIPSKHQVHAEFAPFDLRKSVYSMADLGRKGRVFLPLSPHCWEMRRPAATQRYPAACAAARAAGPNAATMRSKALASWAADTNHASKADGGKRMPASNMAWKKAR